MNPWDVFSELCRRVSEDRDVYLEITIYGDCISMELWPYNDDWEDDED